MALYPKAALRLDRGMLGNAAGGGTGTVSQVLTSMQWDMSTHRLQSGRDMPEPRDRARLLTTPG